MKFEKLMDKKTQGAWVIHHGKKINGTANAAASYPAIDIAAKAGALLSRMAQSQQSTLNADQVKTLGIAGGLSPKTELPFCLDQLQKQKVIDKSEDGSVSVIGITATTALDHTSDLLGENEPESYELAALELGELVSEAPLAKDVVAEKIGDEFKLSSQETDDFLGQAAAVGFIESDGDGSHGCCLGECPIFCV